MTRLASSVSFILVAAVLGLGCSGCSAMPGGENGDRLQWPTIQSDGSLVLVSGGLGYQTGDVVLVDTDRVPRPGDVVQYDARTNLSDCNAFGPGQYLARVAANPGAMVRFEQCMFVAGCYLGAIECGPELFPRTQNVCWGDAWYNDVVGLTLQVPEDEYLAHGWIGQECRQMDGASVAGSRFTVKGDAIIGVIVKKLGHDDEMQQYLEGIAY